MIAAVRSEAADPLEALQAELAELAFGFDRRGQHEAADLAMNIRARLEGIRQDQREVRRGGL